MEIDKAKWILADMANRTIKNEYIEAINELLAYTKNLEQTVALLQKTKGINDK